ncbi:MAG: ATP-binding protein [Candidatus Rokuibacteriota bacterium]
MKLRSHLIALVVVTLVPILIFSLVLVVRLHRSERAAIERGLQETARALAVALDAQLMTDIEALKTLGASEHLDHGDFRAFYALAARVKAQHPHWDTVLLTDATGQQLLNLRQPYGTPLPPTPGNQAAFRQVMESGRPLVTDLFAGPVAKAPVIGIRVPVMRQGRPRYMMSAGMAPQSFGEVLVRQKIPADWTGAVVDRNHVILARTRAPEEFVGRPVTADLAARLRQGPEGTARAFNQEGAATYAAFARSAVSGWAVVLGLPAASAEGSLMQSLATVTAAGLAMLLVGVGLAALLGRRIAAPIVSLSAAAATLDQGEIAVPARAIVAEVGDLARALEKGARSVREHAAALRARESELRLITDAVPVLISYVDAGGRYRFNNRAYEEWFGQPAAAVAGRHLSEVMGQAAYEMARPHVEAALAGQPATYERLLPYREGGSRYVRATLVPDRDESGRVRGFVALVTDLTGERVNAAQLREQAETLEIINRTGPLLSAELDLEKLVQAVTDAATKLSRAAFGAFFYNLVDDRGESYTLYAISGVSREAFDTFPMPRNTALFGATFRGEGVVRIDDVHEDPRYGKSPPHHGMPEGHLPVRSYLAVPVVSRSGDVLGGLFFGHPERGMFTEREERLVVGLAAQAAVAMDNTRLYEKEQRARTEAEAANRSKDEFLATLSHELRTPLNAVLGWARMLRRGQLEPGTQDRALDIIERNAQAQVQLIEDLLDVSRIITGKLRLDVRPVSLAGIVEAALDSVRPAAESKGVHLTYDLDPRAGPLAGDSDRLQQVVWNLVLNAIKFTDGGGRVQVSTKRADAHVEIVVSDTGRGIALEVLPHIFERFRQGDSTTTRAHGGLGIGLALVRHLVELHGGTVHATSLGDNQGAVFTVRLPVMAHADTDADGQRRQPAARGRLDHLTFLKDVKLLVVDDEPDTLELFAAMLAQQGAVVRTVGSAAAALHALADWTPDVLVSDIGMPDEDGYALIRRVRALEADRGGRIPAIAVTAYGSVEDRIRVLSAGFDSHVPKPVESAELATVIASLLARRR